MTTYELPEGSDLEQRRQRGVFYTPGHIVDFMVANVLKDKPLPLKICDYSCGSGAFLAGVLRYFRKNFPGKTAEAAQDLFGIDIDPAALRLAGKNLPEIPEKNFWCADTLKLSLPENQKFDLIIGNPPYRCCGLRNSASFPASEQQHLKEIFRYGFEYKMNLFALFIEQALKLSRETCLIVPDSLLCGKYFSKLRRFIAENFHLKGLWLLEKPAFDAAAGNCVIIHVGSGKPAHTGCCCFAPDAPLEIPENIFSISQTEFLKEPRCRFQLAFSQFEYDLLHKISDGADMLGDHLDFASGIIARNGKSSLISATPLPGSKPGIISGSEIVPFEIRHKGFFIDLTRSKIKSGLKPERFAVPKIFLRQTGNSPVAAASTEELYALNNCHVGIAKDGFPIETATALLNSSILNFAYRFLSGERNRNFAQIDIDILNSLPLRRSKRFDAFAVECMNFPELRKSLDAETAKLYGITGRELDWIKKELAPRRK